MSKSPKRPRRSHGAIDRLPEEVRRQIQDWYLGRPDEDVPRLTYEGISKELGELGHKISKAQVFRWIQRQRNDLERLERVRERAKALAENLVPDGANVEQAAVFLTGGLCLEALSGAEIQQVKSIEDLAKMASSLGQLQRSSVYRDKWEHEKRQKIDAAVDVLKEKVRALLEKHPELLQPLVVVIDEAREQMIAENA